MIEHILDKENPLLSEVESITQRIVARKQKRGEGTDPLHRNWKVGTAMRAGHLAEAAFVDLTNLEWHNRSDEDYHNKGDVGRYHIRATYNERYNLKLQEHDKDGCYILAVITEDRPNEFVSVRFVGWTTLKAGRKVAVQRMFPNHPEPVQIVLQKDLFPMDWLPEFNNF